MGLALFQDDRATEAEQLEALASASDEFRSRVAALPIGRSEIQGFLLRTTYHKTTFEMLKNPSLTPENQWVALRLVSSSRTTTPLCYLASNPGLVPEVQAALADREDAHPNLAANPGVSGEVVRVLAKSAVRGVLRTLAANPGVVVSDDDPVSILQADAVQGGDRLSRLAEIHEVDLETLQGLLDNWVGTVGELVEAARLVVR